MTPAETSLVETNNILANHAAGHAGKLSEAV